MDIQSLQILANQAVEIITPALPALLAGGKEIGKGALNKLGGNITDGISDKARSVFDLICKKEGLPELAEKVANEEAGKKELLEKMIKTHLECDEEFLQCMQGVIVIDNSVSATLQGDNSTLIAPHRDYIDQRQIYFGENVKESAPDQQEMLPNYSPEESIDRYMGDLVKMGNYYPLAKLMDADDVVLESVFVELDSEEQVEDKKNIINRKARNSSEEDIGQLSLKQCVEKHNKLFLLGDPGSGKSSFLKQLAVEYARGYKTRGIFPVFIPLHVCMAEIADKVSNQNDLSGFEREKLLQDVMQSYLYNAVFCRNRLDGGCLYTVFSKKLSDGKVLFLFDGLDEVTEDLRSVACDVISAMCKMPDCDCRVLVTCRVRSFNDSLRPSGFHISKLAKLTPVQVKLFIEKWYTAQALKIGEDVADKALPIKDLQVRALEKNLIGFAENPMLLTCMAIIHRRDTKLPKERVKLYDGVIRLLLIDWQSEKKRELSDALTKLLSDDKRLQEVVEYIAYLAIAARPKSTAPVILEHDYLLTSLAKHDVISGDYQLACDLLDFVDHFSGIIRGLGGEGAGRPRQYDFPHKTFAEYLAGRHLLYNNSDDVLERALQDKIGDGENWYNVVDFAGEELLYNNRRGLFELKNLIQQLALGEDNRELADWRHLLYAGKFAAMVGRKEITQDSAKQTSSKQYLESLLKVSAEGLKKNDLTVFERVEMARSISALGDPRFNPDFYCLPFENLCGFVEIPASMFWMGDGDKKSESRKHKVDIYAYYMSMFPVTIEQYKLFKPELNDLQDVSSYDANRPITNITFYDALEYCKWLTNELCASERTPDEIQNRLRDGWSITLPSEAEWEKAARGTDGWNYPWGNEFKADSANYSGTNLGKTSGVGCFPKGRSVYGVEDTAGNVWEWTRSLWGEDFVKAEYSYPYKIEDNQRENVKADDSVFRVVRGGSFFNDTSGLRSAYRLRSLPYSRSRDIGFRVVLSPFSQSER